MMYTKENWKNDKVFKALPGQEVSADVYDEMFECNLAKMLPSETAEKAWKNWGICVHEGFLMGEPHSCTESGELLYHAFGSNDYGHGKHYYYLGLSKAVRKLTGTYYFFDCMESSLNRYFKESKFVNESQAIQLAINYEATLSKEVFSESGLRTSYEILYQPAFQ